MVNLILVMLHGIAVLLFGVFVSAAFSGIAITRKNVGKLLIFCLCDAAAQAALLFILEESLVWKLYPLITHLPLIMFIVIAFRKLLITALASVFTAYLCCQPAKWFGVLTGTLTDSAVVECGVRILVLIIVYALMTAFFARRISDIFNGDPRVACAFAVVPAAYYLFDYATVIYTDIWVTNNRIAVEFMPFFISVIFIVFCVMYYREYERKFEAERKEQIVRLVAEQQAQELEAMKRSQQEIRVLRHDLRLFLSTLAVCIETDEKSVVQGMIQSYSEHVDGTKIKRFCTNDTVNYVLSDFEAKCEADGVTFLHKVEIGDVVTNEILFSSILSNALDNALKAAAELPEEKRTVTLMLREANGRLLFSVKNPVEKEPDFVDGMPVTNRKGHGYGTQSIRYMTEKLGGNCQFTVKDSVFITRVIV